MSRTALERAIRAFDLDALRALLDRDPDLRDARLGPGQDLLRFCAARLTHGKPDAARRQLRMARWLVARGFDPRARYIAEPESDDEPPTEVSLAWYAVAKARNTTLARYFLEQGAAPHGLFAAAWWGDDAIVPHLVARGADINERVGATPLHMAVEVARRGSAGKPEVARRRLRFITTMLRLGADPDLPADDGTTPLHTALKKGYLDVFKVLLRNGADPDVPGPNGRTARDIAIHKRDTAWRSALHDEPRSTRRKK